MARPAVFGLASWPAPSRRPASSRKAPPPKSPHTPEAGRAYDEHGNVRPADGRWLAHCSFCTGDPEPDTQPETSSPASD